MKKILFALSLFGALAANAQQVDGSFNITWSECTPWTGSDNTKTIGTTPKNWCISHVIGMNGTGATKVADEVTGRSGLGYAVKLYNAPNSVQSSKTVPGYITLGTTWSTAQGIFGRNPDGGTWGGKSFAYKPDAINFWYKRTASEGNADKPASVIAYLWKGTYKQENVPSEISAGAPTKVTMENRDANIMGKTTAQGGDITSKGTRIAQIETYITDVKTDWTEKTIEFTYEDKNSTPEMINIIFAASDYFNQSVAKDNTFTIDDVTLVYYSTLATLTFNNEDILSKPTTTSSDGKTITIDMSDTQYQAGKIAYTLKGVGASLLSANYDPETNIYTIKVAGNDNDANNSNVTTYNIQFMKVVSILNGVDIKTTAGKAQVTMTRSFKQGWNTVCLPFATTATKLGATKVQEFTAGDDKSVTFSEVADGNIAANTPYLVYFPMAKSSAYTDVVDLEDSNPKDVTHGAFTFIGNYKSGLNMNGFYGVADVKGVQCLRRGGSTAILPAGCAYFVSTNANANGLAINFDGQTTGITTIEAADAQTTGAVYNLQGIKVSANGTAGLPAGIYIQGGRKVIVK